MFHAQEEGNLIPEFFEIVPRLLVRRSPIEVSTFLASSYAAQGLQASRQHLDAVPVDVEAEV